MSQEQNAYIFGKALFIPLCSLVELGSDLYAQAQQAPLPLSSISSPIYCFYHRKHYKLKDNMYIIVLFGILTQNFLIIYSIAF